MADFKNFWTKKLTTEAIKGDVLYIPCDDIRPNRSQPRWDFNDNELIKLADSIQRYGVIQPLVVRKADIDDIYKYELIAGERRLRASKLAGLFAVPCVVSDADEARSAELAIIENLLRSDLNMFELAYALKNLSENYGLTQEEIAQRVSMSQSAVANKIRLLRLTYEEQQAILLFSLTERHARALLRLDPLDDRMSIISRAAEKKMSVAELEEYIELLIERKKKASEESKAPKAESIDDEEYKRSTESVIKGIKKRIAALSKLGANASLDVLNDGDDIELRIKISR